MNKLQMAHEWAIETMRKDGFQKHYMQETVRLGWEYADAMQAEADKRTQNEPRATHKNLEKFTMYPEYDATINYPPDAWVTYNGEARLAVSINDDSLRKRP